MKILLTGVTGYIGKRLLPVLLDNGHEVICCVRDRKRFDATEFDSELLKVIEVDFLSSESLSAIPDDINASYYLIHSMSASTGDFESLELKCAVNFKNRISETKAEQVIYLSGIVNEKHLSAHLQSRKSVEDELKKGSYQLTTLKAGIIVGSGSASFEIIRDLVEKLPVMITPEWLNTKSQPISIRNVIQFLHAVLLFPPSLGNSYDIGGPQILTYKEMLLIFAETRGMKRYIYTLPVMTPRLSSYWLYFVTSTSYKLAVNLVHSMKVEVICSQNNLRELLNIELLTYQDSVRMAFDKIEQKEVLSSWTDALSGDKLHKGMNKLLNVPTYGCLTDIRKHKVDDLDNTLNKIWSIGGSNGWYSYNFLWEIRGFIDKIFGGVGLRRGRKNQKIIKAGETLDFWRVVYISRPEKRMLLYAEMKLPGEAWLEFKIEEDTLVQIATFRPKGIAGRLYWYSLLPMHHFIFGKMVKKIALNT